MNETTKIERISVSKANLSKMADRYGCSKVTVYNALAGRSHSEQAKELRVVAINEYGGKISIIQKF